MNKEMVDNRNNYTSFGSLKVGDCFTDHDDLFIKIPNLYDDYDKQCNAINIHNGSAYHYYDEDNVEGISNLKVEIS